jgi:hypothetical protein
MTIGRRQAMKVFSKAKYEAWCIKFRLPILGHFANACDGMVAMPGEKRDVIHGRDGVEYGCIDKWCEEVPDAIG